jgi:gas vesicle protein
MQTEKIMENQSKNILATAIAGMAVGTLLGVLFAPAKGSETRAAIADKASDLKDSAKDLKEEIKNKFSNNSMEPSDLLNNLKDQVETTLSKEKKSVKDSLLKQIQELEEAIAKA